RLGGRRRRAGRLRGRDGRRGIRPARGLPARPRLRLRARVRSRGLLPPGGFRRDLPGDSPHRAARAGSPRGGMKIKEIRTRVVEWRGKTVALPPHFCTNPMDLLALPEASMRTFTFHGWLVVEIVSDDGQVGVGNAALAPRVTKQVIDL